MQRSALTRGHARAAPRTWLPDPHRGFTTAYGSSNPNVRLSEASVSKASLSVSPSGTFVYVCVVGETKLSSSSPHFNPDCASQGTASSHSVSKLVLSFGGTQQPRELTSPD